MNNETKIKEAQHIIKLIADGGDHDEINALYWAMINLEDEGFDKHVRGSTLYYRHKSWPDDARTVMMHGFEIPDYMSSMDALLKCVPEGWDYEMHSDTENNLHDCRFYNHDIKNDNSQFTVNHPTIHAAFLTAILMAYIEEWKSD